MTKDIFTIPFIIGVIYFIVITVIRFVRWFGGLSRFDKGRVWKGLPTKKTWLSVKEIINESLLHRKIFSKNPVLGYMHMCFAFGWFMLILIGHFEAVAYKQSLSFPFYLPIFFRYYATEAHSFFLSGLFGAMMDFFLLMILSGLALAFYKRFRSNRFGMKRTTKLRTGDKFALLSLWFIFPLRFFAESVSAALHHNGSFITQPSGAFLDWLLPVNYIEQPAWIAYSIALGIFFVALPNSRYMHIPAEPFFIFIRNYGVKLKKRENTYTNIQVFSCSRCGICLDACQLAHADINNAQSVYMLKNIRNKNLTDDKLFNCLLCGRCQDVCPVGIELNGLRITQRIESTLEYNASYKYLTVKKDQTADVIYYAGCMTHLTPSIIKSMTGIFEYAGVDYLFLDENKAACCGRPLMLAGQYNAAQKLIENNTSRIFYSGARILVVSCPICYKVFNEDYVLPGVEVLHHSQYLLALTLAGKLPYTKSKQLAVYHDPCELGRGSGVYDQPRALLKKHFDLIETRNEKNNAFCCGGSLANIKIQEPERNKIRDKALAHYMADNPNLLVTSCPLCKKTFTKGNEVPVMDIAEVVYHAIKNKGLTQKRREANPVLSYPGAYEGVSL